MSMQQTNSDRENDAASTSLCWVAVASADHVARGLNGEFMQVCHGKQGPLKRVKPDDLVVYYSPTFTYQKKDTCQSFTALGRVISSEPYQVVMSDDFMPYRYDVAWLRQQYCPIRPLLQTLSFTRDNPRWGYQFR
ncbi:EVE domain-containing protein [Marinomonas gallaica]|uniref:EVE domain-containing protein n=1 Tax=Marinomonas gallaica TaxID=1806667 RepID=UPI000AC427EF|nr:EVE domain-containing protein [Marinomonas gallaica]